MSRSGAVFLPSRLSVPGNFLIINNHIVYGTKSRVKPVMYERIYKNAAYLFIRFYDIKWEQIIVNCTNHTVIYLPAPVIGKCNAASAYSPCYRIIFALLQVQFNICFLEISQDDRFFRCPEKKKVFPSSPFRIASSIAIISRISTSPKSMKRHSSILSSRAFIMDSTKSAGMFLVTGSSLAVHFFDLTYKLFPYGRNSF